MQKLKESFRQSLEEELASRQRLVEIKEKNEKVRGVDDHARSMNQCSGGTR